MLNINGITRSSISNDNNDNNRNNNATFTKQEQPNMCQRE